MFDRISIIISSASHFPKQFFLEILISHFKCFIASTESILLNDSTTFSIFWHPSMNFLFRFDNYLNSILKVLKPTPFFFSLVSSLFQLSLYVITIWDFCISFRFLVSFFLACLMTISISFHLITSLFLSFQIALHFHHLCNSLIHTRTNRMHCALVRFHTVDHFFPECYLLDTFA